MRSPKSPAYDESSYWDDRFTEEKSYDWLVDFQGMKSILERYLKHDSRILILGCGNSTLGEKLFARGYRNVTNVDFSSVLIERMRSLHPEMSWVCADIRQLRKHFAPSAFDVIIEKATIDALLSTQRDIWTLPVEKETELRGMLSQISEILSPSGVFLSFTFAQPHFRVPLYASPQLNWSLQVEEMSGLSLPCFCYVMRSGCSLQSEWLDKLTYWKKYANRSDADEKLPVWENELDFLSAMSV